MTQAARTNVSSLGAVPLIEETARHTGHADIIRESLDGKTFYELMAAAEGWPVGAWSASE